MTRTRTPRLPRRTWPGSATAPPLSQSLRRCPVRRRAGSVCTHANARPQTSCSTTVVSCVHPRRGFDRSCGHQVQCQGTVGRCGRVYAASGSSTFGMGCHPPSRLPRPDSLRQPSPRRSSRWRFRIPYEVAGRSGYPHQHARSWRRSLAAAKVAMPAVTRAAGTGAARVAVDRGVTVRVAAGLAAGMVRRCPWGMS